MRTSGTLLRLARALVEGAPAAAACSRATAAEPLSRLLPTPSAVCIGDDRAFSATAAAAPAYDYDDDAELQQQEWEYGSAQTSHTLVTDRVRTLDDFEQLIGVLIRRRRAYKIRDVFEEMDLSGVAPAALTYFRVMFACMKARRLGDTLYYWQRMQRHGIEPDARTYGIVISAAGRSGQTQMAVQLMDEMRAKELKPTKNTYLAALNAMAESARVDESWALINEMQANGIPPDEFAYTAIINGYKRAVPAPLDVEKRIDDLLQRCRQVESMEFSRGRSGGVGIVAFNAALNTFCELGFHDRVVSMFEGMAAKEGLTPDYDSYSAVITSYLKEAVRAYRQFATSHPGSRAHMQLLNPKHDAESDGEDAGADEVRSSTASFAAAQQSQRDGGAGGGASSSSSSSSSSSPESSDSGGSGSGIAEAGSAAEAGDAAAGGAASQPQSQQPQQPQPQPQPQAAKAAFTEAPAPFSAEQHASRFNAEPQEVAPEYQHLQRELGLHLTKLKARVNQEAWNKTIEVYNEAARKGLSLSPGVYYDLMRTAVLMANAGYTDALGFAEHCLQEMSALGMFLNTHNGSVILAACSRHELPAALPFAHRLWDVLVMNGRVPKTNAIKVYLRALQQREPQWTERIQQVKQVAAIDPGRLRNRPDIPQKPRLSLAHRKYVQSQKEAALQKFKYVPTDQAG